MPKTKDAFAFCDFDDKRILQRSFFRSWREEFHFADDETDKEIFSALRATDTDKLYVLEAKLDALDALVQHLRRYMKRVNRHADRLTCIARAVADKLAANENADVAALRRCYKRAHELLNQSPASYKAPLPVDNVVVIKPEDTLSENLSVIYLFWESRYIARDVDDEIKRRLRLTFAARLKAARKSAGLTQSQLAALLRVTRRVVAGYEAAENEPSITILTRCSHKLQKTVDWLLGGIEP